MENSQKLFVTYKIHKKKLYSIVHNNVEHALLIDGYLDMDIKLSVIQNKITETIKLCYFKGPNYCAGSRLNYSKKLIYEKHEIPKKYQKYFDKLVKLYNNYLEEDSKQNNKSNILIF